MNAVTPSIPNPTSLLVPVWLAGRLARGIALLRAVGPYVAIELILPGGTLLALLFWLYRRYQRGESLPPFVARAMSTIRASSLTESGRQRSK